MSVKSSKELITGDEYAEERLGLIHAGKGNSPEMKALEARIIERDEYLWDRYSPPLKERYPNQWAAISENGESIVRPTSFEALDEGTQRFGAGNFAYGKLAEFPGHDLSRC